MENITENNRLIAEFMGLNAIVVTNGIVFKDNNNTNKYHPIIYHSDWNWIAEVVNKITCSKEFNVYPDDRYFWDAWNSINIENIFYACIEFIEWYNQQGGN